MGNRTPGVTRKSWRTGKRLNANVTPAAISFMQSPHIKNILCLLSLSPVHTSRPHRPLPRHWKSNQKFCFQPQTLGEQLRKHRLELQWLQTDVASKIGISSASVSDWERGITSPSRRMTKKIQEFLGYTPKIRVREKRSPNSYCSTCGISEASPERCLFEASSKCPMNINGDNTQPSLKMMHKSIRIIFCIQSAIRFVIAVCRH